MEKPVVSILGIPVDNCSLDETVEAIIQMTEEYAKDGRARQVVTINVDFMVNALAWSKGSRHPELLYVLRHADLVTADGMPIVWASRLLGTPLKQRVAGSDIVPALAAYAVRFRKSIYFLGGYNNQARQAAETLCRKYPGLIVAGTGAPFVQVEGQGLMDAETCDAAIVDEINISGADILLIGFGNPKQELWFHRNRHRLNVAVSIGVGGTFAFITGDTARAPAWMQKNGLEWIYRIIQDPKRLWKRYFIGFFKFSAMLLPVIVYYRYLKARHRLGLKLHGLSTKKPLLSQNAGAAKGIDLIRMPASLDAGYALLKDRQAIMQASEASRVILDFTDTRFIDSSGIGMVLRIFKHREEDGKKQPYLLGLSPVLIHTLKITRIWDLVQGQAYDHINDIWKDITKKGMGRCSLELIVEDMPDAKRLYPVGRMDATGIAGIDKDWLFNSLSGQNCMVDLASAEFVDSSGLGLFLNIRKLIAGNGKALVLYHMPEPVYKLFQVTKLDQLFMIEADAQSAGKRIKAF